VNLLKSRIFRSSAILALIIVVGDQLTKYFALQNLKHFAPIKVVPMLNWHLTYNQGAAFGFLANYGGFQRYFLLLVAITISCFIICKINQYKYQPNKKYESLALAMILGGALGNFIDRLRFGYVIDFIDCYCGSWHWYTFNVADIFICLGVGLYFIVANDD